MKKLMTGLITIFILIIVNVFVSLATATHFLDFAFVIGLGAAFLIKFFNSSGGFSSRSLDLSVQSQTGMKQESAEKKFQSWYQFLYSTFVRILNSHRYFSNV
ncbi:hypothetical protein [Halobacillus yeomjeoni]|uniref:Uncharacterized protein n=1 Tax=Halobacillus yeomjeoni TaxID=311194 RepID=A0A931MTZ0_9BACI|nr:hypothetical protein [Halobacillus yeomjeoni]MBH0228900.1 hypothetical protein [Halobacillus yeomjeoni]